MAVSLLVTTKLSLSHEIFISPYFFKGRGIYTKNTWEFKWHCITVCISSLSLPFYMLFQLLNCLFLSPFHAISYTFTGIYTERILTCIRALYRPPETPAHVSTHIHTQTYRYQRHPWSLVDRRTDPHPLPDGQGSC